MEVSRHRDAEASLLLPWLGLASTAQSQVHHNEKTKQASTT